MEVLTYVKSTLDELPKIIDSYNESISEYTQEEYGYLQAIDNEEVIQDIS